jgi:tRNA pseudouridine13 synthase
MSSDSDAVSIGSKREAEPEALVESSPKRIKLSLDDVEANEIALPEPAQNDQPTSILPPSHALLGAAFREYDPNAPSQLLETDVGISEYVHRAASKIDGIIKQRCAAIAYI